MSRIVEIMLARCDCLGNTPMHKGGVDASSAPLQPRGTESAPTRVMLL